MTKRVQDDHEVPREGSDKVKPAGDRTKDNLNNDRTVDNKVIEQDREKEADGFSVTKINVGEIQQANEKLHEKLQNSGSAFQLFNSKSGEVVAEARKSFKKEGSADDSGKSSKSPSADSPQKLDSTLETSKPERSKKIQENYDSATISTKAVYDQQMSIYQKALETTTDPVIREQLKQQATMLDKMTAATSQQSSDTTFGSTSVTKNSDTAHATRKSGHGSENTLAAGSISQGFETNHEYKDLYNKSIKLSDVKHGKAPAHEKSFPSTVQKDSLNRVIHVSNQVADYDVTYARDNKGMETTFPAKVSIAEKTGQKHVYEKKADGWHVDGAKSVANIRDIFVNADNGTIVTDYKNGARRINYPEGAIERSTPNTSEIKWPDGRISSGDALGTKFTRTPDGHGGYVDHHSGPRPDDAFVVTKKSDGSIEVREKAGDKPYKSIDEPHIKIERDRLLKLATENISNPEELSRFHANMARFENREHAMESNLVKQGKTPQEAARLAHEEIGKTYSQISRLLEAGDKPDVPVTEFTRTMIAEQLMRNASNPSVIDQGCYNTCNVATVEVRTFMRHPSDGAKLVVDMATTGKYSFHGDKEVRINKEAFQNFSPDDLNPPRDSVRSLASQLFQVTAVNIHYALQPSLGPIGQTHYNQLPPKCGDPPDNGEQLVCNLPWTKAQDSPQLFAADIAQISREITKDQPKEALIVFDTNKFGEYDTVADEKSLQSKLKYAKEHGLLPITIGVHTGNEPFYTDSGAGTAGGSGGWHVVNVMDYQDGASPVVTLDNQWGSKCDHTGKNKLSLDDVYFSMRSPTDENQIAELQRRHALGNLNMHQELDLDRSKFLTGKIVESEYGKCIEKYLLDVSKRLSEGKVDESEYLNFVNQCNSKLPDMSAPKRFELLQFEKEHGIIENQMFKDLVVQTVVQIQLDHQEKVDKNVSDTTEKLAHKKALDRYTQVVKIMAKEDQVDVRNRCSSIMAQIRKSMKAAH